MNKTIDLHGYKLREAVAQEIMGLNIKPTKEQISKWNQDQKDFSDAWDIYGSELGAAPPYPEGPDAFMMLKYESDIVAAWKVVEKIQKRKWKISVEWTKDKHDNWAWWCSISDASHLLLGFQSGDSAQEAICRAALEAINA